MDQTFKPGDVVTLIGGGLPMTVSHQDKLSDQLWLVWFDRNGHLCNGSAPSAALVKIDKRWPDE